jgi:hypothetical protein
MPDLTGSPRRRLAALALALLVAAGCSPSDPTPAPGATPTAVASDGAQATTAAPADPTPEATQTPEPLATPELLADGAMTLGLVPPDPGEGEVPPVEPATTPVKAAAIPGKAVKVATGTVGPEGGTITVAASGDPLDGAVITVPAGTYSEPVDFSVTSRTFPAGETAPGFTAVSGLLGVDNGGVATEGEPVLVTIPLAGAVGEDADLVGLYYADDGALEVIPVVEQTESTATVAVEHFSFIFLAAPDWSKVKTTVDSGFRPGVDDWQFPNYGSFIAPGGHCEGQSSTALWYYTNVRANGGSPLHGLFDDNGSEATPDLWQDDSDAYRFASVVQASPLADRARYDQYDSMRTKAGSVAYNAFRAAIATTGQPQLIAIADSAGGHGHAMIVYRVTPTRLYVADPNYPGRLRTIKYDAASGKLGPYSSGDNAGAIAAAGAVSYTQFAYIPRAASSTDATIAARWAEFEAGTSGDSKFPKLALQAWIGKDAAGKDRWTDLTPEYRTADTKVRVRLASKGGANPPATMRAFTGFTSTPASPWGGEATVDLKDGPNELGFYILGKVDTEMEYVDFQRVTVIKGPVDINGTWTGTFTFHDIVIEEAGRKKADEEGCDLAILEALEDAPLPATLKVTESDGTGTAVLIIDARKALGADADADPLTMPIEYDPDSGAIVFDLSQTCGDEAACEMEGEALVIDGAETITAAMTMVSELYSAEADMEVLRKL